MAPHTVYKGSCLDIKQMQMLRPWVLVENDAGLTLGGRRLLVGTELVS